MAPVFADVVGDLTDLLAGRVVVAHNSAFDASFVVAEYGRAGWPLSLTRDMTLCTMRLAGQFGAPAKLGDCCAHFGVELTDAHAALADAEATASLLAAYMHASGERRVWDEWLAFGETMAWPAPLRLGTAPVWRGFARELTAPGSDLMDRVAGLFARVEGLERADEYLDLLTETLQECVLLDRKISGPRRLNAQRRALEGMAGALGLTADDVARLNRHYILGMVDAVCADDQLTRQERALVIQLAGLLDLQDLEVEALLARAEGLVSRVVTDVELTPGDLVVLTGMSEARKRELTAVAEARGLVVWPAVKKGVVPVIAQDPGSGSGKARKTREYGIPVVGEGVLGECGLVSIAMQTWPPHADATPRLAAA